MVGIVNKPDINYGIWASNGDVAVPSSEKVEIGHIVEKPKKEIVNWIENRQDQFMAYLNQVGISEWDSKTTYKANVSFVNRSGTVYKAKSQNIDKDPTLNQDIWIIAWSTYEDFYNLSNKVDKIENEEGYLSLYVSKSNPIMTGDAKSPSYLINDLNVGLSSDVSGNPVIIKKDGKVATFKTIEDLKDPTTSVVTMDVLLEFIQQYKVGDIYVTTNSGNPSAILGYGNWRLFSEGKTLVGRSEQASDPNWTKVLGTSFGEYDHQLTDEELAKHNHSQAPFNKFTSKASESGKSTVVAEDYLTTVGEFSIGSMGTVDWVNATEGAGGGDQPHNNVQPSLIVNMWLRTS